MQCGLQSFLHIHGWVTNLIYWAWTQSRGLWFLFWESVTITDEGAICEDWLVDVETLVAGRWVTRDQRSPLFLLFQEAEKGAWKRTRTSARCRSQQRRTDELCWYLAAWRSALWLLFCFFFYIFNGIKNVNIWTFSMGRGIGLEQDHSCLRHGGRGMEQIWTFFSGAVCTDGRFFCSFIIFKAFCIFSGTVLQ